MRVHRIFLPLVVSCAISAPAFAQFTTSARSRPSEGPSQRIGEVGGRATREGVSQIDQRSFGGGGGPILGSYGLTPDAAPYSLPAEVLPAAVGRSYPWNHRSPLVEQPGRYSRIDLGMVSGYSTAVSDAVPLFGVESDRIRPARINYPLNRPSPSAFHELFGLEPLKEDESATSDAAPVKSAVELLDEWNQNSVAMSLERALRFFRISTTPGAELQSDALARSVSALELVRQQRQGGSVADVLLVHAALRRNQIVTASAYLYDVVERNPGYFTQPVDLASYFGDPEMLKKQMQSFVRVGDENPHIVDAQALQAYCAWVLGDIPRVRLTIEAIKKLSAEKPEARRSVRIAFAIEAALK